MSKKFGINTKSTEARARKDTVKQANEHKREQNEHEKLQRKQEIQKLLEQEKAALTASKSEKSRSTIKNLFCFSELKRTNANEEELPIEENFNRLQIDGHSVGNVHDAIQVLQSSQSSADSHPEKRMKAAYETFEKENLPKLKQEHPTLRLSQLKQLLKKNGSKHQIILLINQLKLRMKDQI